MLVRIGTLTSSSTGTGEAAPPGNTVGQPVGLLLILTKPS